MRYLDFASFGLKKRHRAGIAMESGTCALLSGLSLGVGLMYFLDADNGRRRRQFVVDKLGSWARSSGCAVGEASRDAGTRLKGIAQGAARLVKRPEPATDGPLTMEIPAGKRANGGDAAEPSGAREGS